MSGEVGEPTGAQETARVGRRRAEQVDRARRFAAALQNSSEEVNRTDAPNVVRAVLNGVSQVGERGVLVSGGVRKEREIEFRRGFDVMFHRELALERGRRLERERLKLFLRRLGALGSRPFDVLRDRRFRFRLDLSLFLTERAIRDAALLEPVRGALFVDETAFKVKNFALPKGRGDRFFFRAVAGRLGRRVGERRSVDLLIVRDERVGAVAFAVRHFEVAGRRQRVRVGARQRFRLEREEDLLQNRRVRSTQPLDANDAGEFRDSGFLRFERRREDGRNRSAEFALHRERTFGG